MAQQQPPTQPPDTMLWSSGDDESFAPKPQRTAPKKISVEEIAETFELVAQDIAQIGKLTNEENGLLTSFLKTLKTHLDPIKKPIGVSTQNYTYRLRRRQGGLHSS